MIVPSVMTFCLNLIAINGLQTIRHEKVFRNNLRKGSVEDHFLLVSLVFCFLKYPPFEMKDKE